METTSCSSKKGRPCKLSERQKRTKAKRQANTFKDRTEGEPNPTLCFRITGGDYLGNRKSYKETTDRQVGKEYFMLVATYRKGCFRSISIIAVVHLSKLKDVVLRLN